MTRILIVASVAMALMAGAAQAKTHHSKNYGHQVKQYGHQVNQRALKQGGASKHNPYGKAPYNRP